jgi:phasin family protein
MSASHTRNSARLSSPASKRQHQVELPHVRSAKEPNVHLKETPTVTKEQLESVSNVAMKSYEQLATLSKASAEAMIKTNAILLKGAEEIGNAWTALARRVVESNMSAMQALVGCKNFNDVVEVQTGWAKTQFETVVAEGTKVSELTLKVANESVRPISASVNETIKSSLKAA